MDWWQLALVALAGIAGGVMNALAGGGTFATLPALIGVGLPANVANATSNFALLPGAATSAWTFRDELAPVGPVGWRTLAIITFLAALVGSVLLVVTPSATFDIIIPWLLLFASLVLAFGPRASLWLHARVTIGPHALFVAQALLGVYGGYFGGGVGLMTTAMYGLLANIDPRSLFAPRTLMLATANLAAAFVFVATGLIDWAFCLPMFAGAIVGGRLGAQFGKRLPHRAVRVWTLIVTFATTAIFFQRAYF